MSCNCKEMEGFALVMFKARSFEEKTGKKAAVFVVNKTTPSFTELENVNNVEGICCYFTTDGVEHKLEKKVVEQIEVVSEEVASKPKRKRTKKG